MLWEQEKAYVDSLGTAQAARTFEAGRASVGNKLSYLWVSTATVSVVPYTGVYADYYFSHDDATASLLPTDVLHGVSGRVTSGLSVMLAGGPKLTIGGELGGLGGNVEIWSANARVNWPF
jgi:hypothetical protein